MYLEERRQEILKLVNQEGRVSVTELSQQFGVSEVTIRADLQDLAAQHLIVRTYGGAIPSGQGFYDLSLAKRLGEQKLEKERIGAAGAALVSNGDAIVLDSSSTTLAVARYLKQRRDLTLITNSLVIAQEMLGAPGVTVVMPGGTLHHDTASLVDSEGLATLRRFHVQRGFFGAHGISFSAGLTDVSAPEVEVKRPLVKMCQHVIAVVDATKWGRAGLASFADLKDVDMIISDKQAPCELVSQVRALGIEVRLV